MNRNLNRRTLSFINLKNLISILFIIFFISIILVVYYQKNILQKYIIKKIEHFSENYNYQYINLKINGLKKIDYSFVEDKLERYNNSSIFLLPLKKISIDLKENNWIKNVKLTTDYKNTLMVDIQEYKPLAIYNFNNKLFYFDNNGKIIQQLNPEEVLNNKYLIFSGQSSNLHAKKFIDTLQEIDFENKFKIKKIIFVENRRWDILMFNNTRLMLSENNPTSSLQNYITIEKTISETEMINIKSIDLRNLEKTIINYNE